MYKISPSTVQISQSSLQSNYTKTVMPNGIRVVTEEIPYVRSVSFGVWIDVGSRDEDEHNNGITHLIEHMVFKGTRRYSSKQIARSLESVGGYLNAFTTKEHTCFYARVLDDHLARAIDVLSELVQHPLFRSKELAKEKLVILEELKNIEDDPDDIIHDYLDLSVYRKHSLGFPIIGRAENVKGFTNQALFDYRDRLYTPERMVVAAAGNLKHDAVVTLVEKYFRQGPNHKAQVSRTAVPKYSRPKKQVFDKPISQAHICMGILSYNVKSRARYSLLVLNSILGEGMSSRLFQNIREKYGLAYSIYSFANLLSDTGSFGVYTGTDNDNIDRSLDLIFRELDDLKREPIGSEELSRAKAQLKGNMMLGLESMSNRMMRLGSGELYFGKYISVDEVLKEIEAVKSSDLATVADKLVRPEDFSIIIFKSRGTGTEPVQETSGKSVVP